VRSNLKRGGWGKLSEVGSVAYITCKVVKQDKSNPYYNNRNKNITNRKFDKANCFSCK